MVRAELRLGPRRGVHQGRWDSCPLPTKCGSGAAHHEPTHMILGIPLDEAMRLGGLMLRVESRGHTGCAKVLCAVEVSGMSLWTARRALRQRKSKRLGQTSCSNLAIHRSPQCDNRQPTCLRTAMKITEPTNFGYRAACGACAERAVPNFGYRANLPQQRRPPQHM